jgi:aldehyde:ferredoxin oxidoreductase
MSEGFGKKRDGSCDGFKNLKAIAVRGTRKPTIADPAKFQSARKLCCRL